MQSSDPGGPASERQNDEDSNVNSNAARTSVVSSSDDAQNSRPTGNSNANAHTERYFSVRWMLERERARDASDDCGSAFAVIPVLGVCLLTLYVIWLDQASQGFMAWLAAGSPLARFLPLKLLSADSWELAGEDDDTIIPGAYA